MTDELLKEIHRRYMNGAEALDGNELAAAYRADVGYLLSQITTSNEPFKKLCKIGTPINCLIGAARSADALSHYNVKQEWIDSMLNHAEEAEKAWDEIIALIEGLTARR